MDDGHAAGGGEVKQRCHVVRAVVDPDPHVLAWEEARPSHVCRAGGRSGSRKRAAGGGGTPRLWLRWRRRRSSLHQPSVKA